MWFIAELQPRLHSFCCFCVLKNYISIFSVERKQMTMNNFFEQMKKNIFHIINLYIYIKHVSILGLLSLLIPGLFIQS